MAKTPSAYVRLTRATAGLGSYTSLWLAADHLMLVKSSGYSEGYQRFQLRDIKGFFIQRSKAALFTTSISGGIAILLGLVGAAQWGSPTAGIWVAFAIPAAVLALLAVFMMRTAKVFIVTGVQTTELTPLYRMKRADRVIAQLTPLIEAAQAEFLPVAVEPTAVVEQVEPIATAPTAELPPLPPAL